MFEVSPPCGPRLQGARVLAVVPEPPRALAIGAALAEAGAVVDVARTLAAAIAALGHTTFEAAIVDFDLGRDVERFVAAVRARPDPCFYAVVGDPIRMGGMQAAFACGAIEIVMPPLSAADLVAAAVRAVDATAVVRARCDAIAADDPSLGGAVTRHGARLRAQQGIDGAIVRVADQLGLSPRERSVLRYLALGYQQHQIGEQLSISRSTVKWHVGNLRRKLGVSSRAELLGVLFAA
jgi:DNA-binding NarL/FixJ family response regulator